MSAVTTLPFGRPLTRADLEPTRPFPVRIVPAGLLA